MSETEVLLLAADILQRKVEDLFRPALGKQLTPELAEAVAGAGIMAHTAELIRDVVSHLKDKVE